MFRPRPLLLAALLVTAVLSGMALFGSGDSGAAVTLAVSRERANVPAPKLASADRPQDAAAGLRIEPRRAGQDNPRDLFEAYSWVRPSAAALAAPPPAPTAPPVPYQFAGSILIDGKPVYVMVDGLRTSEIVPGDQIGDFRLEAGDARRLSFLHLPSGLPQTLEPAAAAALTRAH